MYRRTLGSSLHEVGTSAQDSFGESHAAKEARRLHTDRTNLPAGGGEEGKTWPSDGGTGNERPGWSNCSRGKAKQGTGHLSPATPHPTRTRG
jgi:hypothetical protein